MNNENTYGWIVLIFWNCIQLSVPVHAEPMNNNEQADLLLQEVITSRQKMKNLQFNVEYIDWRDPTEKEKDHNKALDRLEKKGYPRKRLELMRERSSRRLQHPSTYQTQKLVIDNSGRIKIGLVTGILDSSGNKTSNDSKHIWSWDGHDNIDYYCGGGAVSPSVVLSNVQNPNTSKQRQPWRTFTGLFVDAVDRALETDKQISVEGLSDGTYRLSFTDDKYKRIGIIDPTQGFSCILEEMYRNDDLFHRRRAKYGEFADGVWFPMTGETVTFSAEGVEKSKSNMRTTEIRVNDPNFHEGMFHVEFPKGTRVRDSVSGIQYVVGQPMSRKIGTGDPSLDNIAIDALEEMAEEIEQYIPKVGIALKEGKPFVLGLADGKLVNPREKPESQESNKFLTQLSRGDIAWDGTVVATRGAAVFTTKQASKRAVKLTKGRWTGSYKLPEEVQLPYAMLVVTRERANFLISIRKIEPGGITVAYRQLNPDELSRYKQ